MARTRIAAPPALSDGCLALLTLLGPTCNGPDLVALRAILRQLVPTSRNVPGYRKETNALVEWGVANFSPYYSGTLCPYTESFTLFTTYLTAVATDLSHPYARSRLPRETGDITNDLIMRVLARLTRTPQLRLLTARALARYIQGSLPNVTRDRVKWLNRGAFRTINGWEDTVRFSGFRTRPKRRTRR